VRLPSPKVAGRTKAEDVTEPRDTALFKTGGDKRALKAFAERANDPNSSRWWRPRGAASHLVRDFVEKVSSRSELPADATRRFIAEFNQQGRQGGI